MASWKQSRLDGESWSPGLLDILGRKLQSWNFSVEQQGVLGTVFLCIFRPAVMSR